MQWTPKWKKKMIFVIRKPSLDWWNKKIHTSPICLFSSGCNLFTSSWILWVYMKFMLINPFSFSRSHAARLLESLWGLFFSRRLFICFAVHFLPVHLFLFERRFMIFSVLWYFLLLLLCIFSSFIPFVFSDNYARTSNYSGSANPSYNNSLGMNATSPMQGQGPGQPVPGGRSHGPASHNRVYTSMGPSSPSVPQPAGPGMGPPSLGNSNRKNQEAAVGGSMAGTVNTLNNRWGRQDETLNGVQLQVNI